jgi:hypothetical protein
MAQLDPDRQQSQTLTTTEQGALQSVPEKFVVSTEVVTETTTGIPVGDPFAPPDDASFVESKLVQDKTTERTTLQKTANFTGLVLSDTQADPVFGISTQVDEIIAPSEGGVYGVTVVSGGTGYADSTTASSPTPTGGIAAQYTVQVSAGVITGLTILDPGSGHQVAPTITLANTGGGTGASLTALIPSYPTTDASGRFTDISALNKWKSLQSSKSWTQPPVNQNTFNWDLEFAQENASYPSFMRRYLIRRDAYNETKRLANGTAFTGIYEINLTNAGSGYTSAPTVAITSGSGSGATAHAVLNADGTIARIILDTEGSAYIGATVGFSGGGGTGAAASAVIQPATCVLVKEDTQHSEQPWSPIFVLVVRYYKTLPGPARITTRQADDGTTITETKTEKVTGSISPGEAAGTGVWTMTEREQVEGFSYFADEVVESRPIPGNALPFDRPDDLDKAVITGSKTLDFITNITSLVGETISGSDWVVTRMEPFQMRFKGSDVVAWKYVESRPATGNLIAAEGRPDFDQLTVDTAYQLMPIGSIVEGETTSGSNWVRSFGKQHQGSMLVALQYTETRPITGATITEEAKPDFDGITKTVQRTLTAVGSIVDSEVISGSNWVKSYRRQHEGSGIVAIQFVETRAYTGNTIESTRQDFDGKTVTINTTLEKIANISPGEVISGSNLVTTTMKQIDSSVVALQVVESRAATGNLIDLPTEVREGGDIVTMSAQLLPIGSLTTSEAIVSSNWVRSYGKKFENSHLVVLQITESRPETGSVASPTTEERENGDVVTITRQLVPVGSLVSSEVVNDVPNWVRSFGRTVEQSELVVWQMVETRAATGNTGISYRDVENGDTVQITRQLVPVGSATRGETLPGGTSWVLAYSEQHSDSALVVWQVVETRAIPGGTGNTYEDREAGDVVTITSQLIDASTVVTGETINSGNWVRSFGKAHPKSVLVLWEIVESRPAPGNTASFEELREAGDPVIVERTLQVASGFTASEAVSTGVFTRTFSQLHPESQVVLWQMQETRSVPSRSTVTKERDTDGAEVTVTRLLAATPVTTSDAISSNVWTRVTQERYAESEAAAWQVTRARAVNASHAPTLTTYESDPETHDPVTIAKTLVDATTATSVNTANQETEYQAVNAVVSLKIVRTINGGSNPTGYTTYKVGEYSFPRRLYGLSYNGIVDNYGNAYISYNPNANAAQRPKCVFKVVISFPGSFTPTVASYRSFILQAINYNGLFLNVHEGDVINDSLSVTYTTASDNPRWTSVTDSFSFSASSPISATGYNALKGTYLLVSAEFVPWGKFNQYRLEQIYVLVPDES